MSMIPNDLIAHPEGGQFREVFRSARIVRLSDGSNRAALTHIYFSLGVGEVSRFHRVTSDEIWNLYEGPELALYTWEGTDAPPIRHILSASSRCFCHVVSAGLWQAAEPLADTVLVGCSVAPGFEFTDFSLMESGSDEAQRLLKIDPGLRRLVIPTGGQPGGLSLP